MIFEGLKLMIIGMVIVYIFLITLMLCVMISSRIFKDRDTPTTTSPRKKSLKNDELIAVVSAAVQAFKAKKS